MTSARALCSFAACVFACAQPSPSARPAAIVVRDAAADHGSVVPVIASMPDAEAPAPTVYTPIEDRWVHAITAEGLLQTLINRATTRMNARSEGVRVRVLQERSTDSKLGSARRIDLTSLLRPQDANANEQPRPCAHDSTSEPSQAAIEAAIRESWRRSAAINGAFEGDEERFFRALEDPFETEIGCATAAGNALLFSSSGEVFRWDSRALRLFQRSLHLQSERLRGDGIEQWTSAADLTGDGVDEAIVLFDYRHSLRLDLAVYAADVAAPTRVVIPARTSCDGASPPAFCREEWPMIALVFDVDRWLLLVNHALRRWDSPSQSRLARPRDPRVATWFDQLEADERRLSALANLLASEEPLERRRATLRRLMLELGEPPEDTDYALQRLLGEG